MFESWEAYIDLPTITQGAAARGGNQEEVEIFDE